MKFKFKGQNNRKPGIRKPAVLLLFFLVLGLILSAQEADSPESLQQYKYAIGLIQRQLYEEAANVLSRVLSDPGSFSYRDAALFWLAECEYRQNNFTRSIGFYEQLRRDFPQSKFRDRAAYGLGWAHAKDNNPKSAVEAFSRVEKNDKKLWLDARLKMGFLMTKYGMDSIEMLGVYEELLKDKDLSPEQKFDVTLQVGVGHFNASLYESAYREFSEALLLAPPNKKAGILFYMAESLFRNKKFSDAEKSYQEIFAASPSVEITDKSTYSLAWCKIKIGKAQEAVALFERLAGNPNCLTRAEAVKNLVELLMNLHKYKEAIPWMAKASQILSGDEAVDMEYLRGLALSRLGEFADSLTAFKTFIKAHPKHPRAEEAHYQSSLVKIALGKFRDALNDLSPLLRRETTPEIREKAIYRTGECYFNLGNLSSAKDSFERLIHEYPQGVSRADALYQLGEIEYQSGRHSSALEAFTAIGKTGSDLASQAVFRSGEVLMKAGRFVDAVAAFEEYIARFPNGKLTDDAHFKIGLCDIELKETGKALAAFSQLRESKGYFRQEARFQIGEISRNLGNYPLAIQQFKAIVDEEPRNPLVSRVRRAIGICLYKMKDYPGAVATFKAILKDYPSSDIAVPETRLWYGRTLIADGKIDDGILEVLKVPVLHPKSSYVAEAYVEAAKAYETLGKTARSRQMWKEVLKVQPSGPFVAEAHEKAK